MNFGERLREARKAKGYTQEQLAVIIGVAKSTLTGYEKGNREPDVFKIKALSQALDVSAGYLLDIENKSDAPIEASDTDEGLAARVKMFTSYPPEAQDRILEAMRALAEAEREKSDK